MLNTKNRVKKKFEENKNTFDITDVKNNKKPSFCNSWLNLTDFKGWLAAVPNDSTKAKCLLCNKEIGAKKSDLIRHTKGLRHMEIAADEENVITQSTNDNVMEYKTDVIENVNELGENAELKVETENEKLSENMNIWANPDEKLKKPCFCKLCGTTMKSEENEYNLNQKSREYLINEKLKIQNEMRNIIKNVEIKRNHPSRSSAKVFTEMLEMDLIRLPEAVQRKLRIDIMKLVDDAIELHINEI